MPRSNEDWIWYRYGKSTHTRLFAHVFGLRESTRAAMQQRIEAREGILMPQFEPAAGARLLATQDLGHRHILKDAGVLRELAAFVA